MSLLDDVIEELRGPKRCGCADVFGQDMKVTVNGITQADFQSYLDWLNSSMKLPSSTSRAVKEIPVEDMGVYKFSAVDKDGIPVAFYGESFRTAALKYVEENP